MKRDGSKTDKMILPLMMYGRYKGKTYARHNSKGLFPSENNIFINVYRGDKPTGQRALSKMAEGKLKEWRTLALSWKNRTSYRYPPKAKVIVRMWFYLPDHRKRDTGNVPKLLMDALEGVIYENDYYGLPRVMDFTVDSKREPRIEVEIEIKGD